VTVVRREQEVNEQGEKEWVRRLGASPPMRMSVAGASIEVGGEGSPRPIIAVLVNPTGPVPDRLR
jgi:hypothetical protein